MMMMRQCPRTLRHVRRCMSSFTKISDTEGTFRLENAFSLHNVSEGPSNDATVTKDGLMEFFTTMAYYRRFEIHADTLYKERAIRGFCHLYDGQEAIPVGMEDALTFEDSIITAYRDHCQQLGRGDTGERVMAELLGKSGGCSKGKGGSMHMYYPKNNFYGGNGIVGAQIPVGTGVAFAHKYLHQPNICVAMMGDGAANQGQVYEAANMAMLQKLPVVFCIENNHYGMGTSAERAASNTDYYTRGNNIPGIKINGMDVLAVRNGFAWAKKFVLENGPLFMELETYRYHGHSMSDPGISYRTREEVASIRAERDCIQACKQRLIETGWATAAELTAIEKKVRSKVNKDVKFARNSPNPELSEVLTDIYVNETPRFVRGVEFETSHFTKN